MTAKFTDYFDLLGVGADAGNDDIDRGYRRRIKEVHPDRHDNDDDAVERTKLLNAARDILKDAKKRKEYQGRWLLHHFAKQRAAKTAAKPKRSARNRRQHRARPPSNPRTKPTVWTPQPAPPSTPTAKRAGAGLGGLGVLGLLLGGAYLLSKKNGYDHEVGRYRGSDGTFRSGPWR